MAKAKSTYYLDERTYDAIRQLGGSRLIEGLVLLAYLGNLADAAYQVGASWNQKKCPDLDTLELYPQSPEAWQRGVAGIRKKSTSEQEEHAWNLVRCLSHCPDEDSQQQAIAEYLRLWVL
jgi:hypothetical protein